MKILIVGSGGREYTLGWKLAQDTRVDKIYAAPGNGGMNEFAELVAIEDTDIEALVDFAIKKEVDLTIVGPEDPLSMGIVDAFLEKDLRIFGVNKACALLEGSKDYSKGFMEKHNIPTARYKTFTDSESAKLGLEEFSYPVVIKADGLCSGKGVLICQNRQEALAAIEDILEDGKFGQEGNKIVMEEYLDGVEASLLCLVSRNKIYPLEPAQDYKKIYDEDRGPNTGGVGCYSPGAIYKGQVKKEVEETVIKRIEEGLTREGLDFNGVLFIGLMVDKEGAKVLEFNVRFGDPETQVVIPRLKSSLLDHMEAVIDGTIKAEDLAWDERPCMTVILTSGGYPSSYEVGYEIKGLNSLEDRIKIFHNGTSFKDGKYLTNGGRVLSVTTVGDTIEEAREVIYRNIEHIDFRDMYYRTDIGKNIDY